VRGVGSTVNRDTAGTLLPAGDFLGQPLHTAAVAAVRGPVIRDRGHPEGWPLKMASDRLGVKIV